MSVKESLALCDELLNATFRDPEGMFYLARQLSYLRDETKALNMLSPPVWAFSASGNCVSWTRVPASHSLARSLAQ